ncbi:nuclear transport factor 2 family protein [Kibdelosporangium persicum]|uniref:3-phenylpropionate/cinnamic acid dioxygenase small subunit n=1 Tax=Kibdelosporangium persicum TaxID=2698649 RepID=A0ABX2F1W2_9PSEU|nr:nuclear transport factor 2 family protein [Kibdelosporangium persicum]NRN65208.1 3-phenylpropionate/cinnamic acid dioxygenase small subunit [Kibdelosporangium persicum]
MSSQDQLEVGSLFARLSRVLDEARYDDIGTVYADDIVVRSPKSGEIQGLANVIAFLHRNHDNDVLTQHIHGDVLVTMNGDEAEASANQVTYFYRDGAPPHQTSGLRVAYRATRTPAGWRFHEGRIDLAWTKKD